MFEFRIDANVCFIDFIVACLINFDVTIDYTISEALSLAGKNDFGNAWSHVQSHLELSELDVRAHRQADVTDHQLHDQVYYGRYNSDQSTMTQ